MIHFYFNLISSKTIIINDLKREISTYLKDKIENKDSYLPIRRNRNENVDIVDYKRNYDPSDFNNYINRHNNLPKFSPNIKSNKNSRYKPLIIKKYNTEVDYPISGYTSESNLYSSPKKNIKKPKNLESNYNSDLGSSERSPHYSGHETLKDIFNDENKNKIDPSKNRDLMFRKHYLSKHIDNLDKILSGLNIKLNEKKESLNKILDLINAQKNTIGQNMNLVSNIERNKNDINSELQEKLAESRILSNEISGEEKKLDDLFTKRSRLEKESQLLGDMIKSSEDKKDNLLLDNEKYSGKLDSLEREKNYLENDLSELENKKKEVMLDKNNDERKLGKFNYDITNHFY